MNLMEITKGYESNQNEQTEQTKNLPDTTDKWKQLAKEQAASLEKVTAERDELQVKYQKMSEFIQEFQERTHKLKMEKQKLFFENHEMQEEMRKSNVEIQQMTAELSKMRKLNQSLQQSNDDLRNRNGLMSRSEQEQLEEEIKDVRDRNSKLQIQVNQSSVEAVEQAQRKQEEAEKQKLLEELKGKENITPDGRKINIYANIGSVGDLGYVMENDAGGIGLFRSEFLYLGRNDFPTEEEQFQAYKQAVQTMAGKKVIIRTLDIGADKQVEYFNLGKEENPALGYRAIRICLKQPEIFKAQLRALFRAAVYGNLSVMYPMITSTEEVEKIYAIVAEVEEELKKQEVQYKIPEQGIMIETPAAVMISDRLAEMVDFFSIGTNDLTQYTLAIDRQNEQLDDFYNPHHEAVLRMIRMVVENAHKCGKWAGICGELGADLTLTEQFVRMGVDELSVAPSMILKLRKVVREMKAEE